MTTKDRIKNLFEDIRDKWLEENATTKSEPVPFGDIDVLMDVGYSDKDWKAATLHAKEEFEAELKELN